METVTPSKFGVSHVSISFQRVPHVRLVFSCFVPYWHRRIGMITFHLPAIFGAPQGQSDVFSSRLGRIRFARGAERNPARGCGNSVKYQ